MNLVKERVLLTHETVTRDFINVQCEHTIFCKITRINLPNISELEKQVKELRKKLRTQGVKLYKSDTLAILKNKTEYNEKVKEYNDTFDRLVNAWQDKLTKGIHVGWGDDTDMNELTKLEWHIEKMFYRSALLDKVLEIKRTVSEIETEMALNEETSYCAVRI